MVSPVVSGERASDPEGDPWINVDPGRLHIVLTPIELDILVDALHSVGNTELAQRFEAILRQFRQDPSHE